MVGLCEEGLVLRECRRWKGHALSNSWRKCEVAPGTKKLTGTVWSRFVVRIVEEIRGKHVEGKEGI